MCFRKKKTKNIELKQDISQYLVFPYALKGGVVWLNYSAIVSENTLLAFAAREKVLDVLNSGEHMLGAVTLPKASKKFKLYKLKKDGSVPDCFAGFAYYINLNEVQGLKFETYHKLRYKNEIDGTFRVAMNFSVNLKIVNYELLMKCLLNELAYLRLNEAENIVRDWLSEFVTDTLQKETHRRNDFEGNLLEIMELLEVKVKKHLEDFGLEMTKLSVDNVSLSKPPKQKGKQKGSNIHVSQENENKQVVEQPLQSEEQNANSTWHGWEEKLK